LNGAQKPKDGLSLRVGRVLGRRGPLYICGNNPLLYRKEGLPMTPNQEREMLEARLREIDLRRSTLEAVLATLPNTPQRLDREELEIELRDLWLARLALAERLNPSRAA
jgi:hypothetical protein